MATRTRCSELLIQVGKQGARYWLHVQFFVEIVIPFLERIGSENQHVVGAFLPRLV